MTVDIPARLFRYLIEGTPSRLEWISATENIYYCDIGNFRIVVTKKKTDTCGTMKWEVHVMQGDDTQEDGFRRCTIDSQRQPRYRILAEQLWSTIKDIHMLEGDIDVLNALAKEITSNP